MWTRHKQQQQRGVQFRPQSGAAPEDAVKDRAAQDHEQAVVAVSPPEDGEPGPGEPAPGAYPASRMEDGHADNTPSAPAPRVDWDDVVQPEQQQRKGGEADDLPLPEGK